MAKSRFQNYDTETINRSEIKNAPYNPRIMDAKAKKRLKEGIAKHGLVSALTWNRRTGNLVGGHQRLEQLDSLEKDKNYELTVCVIDVDEREEAALNVQLNNPSMQGEWDFDKLANICEEFDLDLKNDMSFTDTDIDLMFEGDDRFSQLYENETTDKIRGSLEDIKKPAKRGKKSSKNEIALNGIQLLYLKMKRIEITFTKKSLSPSMSSM